MVGEGLFNLSQGSPKSGYDLYDKLDYFTILPIDFHEWLVIPKTSGDYIIIHFVASGLSLEMVKKSPSQS